MEIKNCPQPYRRSRAGQIVLANIKRIVTKRGEVNDNRNSKTMNYLTARQVGGYLYLSI